MSSFPSLYNKTDNKSFCIDPALMLDLKWILIQSALPRLLLLRRVLQIFDVWSGPHSWPGELSHSEPLCCYIHNGSSYPFIHTLKVKTMARNCSKLQNVQVKQETSLNEGVFALSIHPSLPLGHNLSQGRRP